METARISVHLTSDRRSYEILIRDGLIDEVAWKPPLCDSGSFFVVTDSNVARLYGKRLVDRMSGPNRRVRMVSFPAGEANKNIRTAWTVAAKLSELGADRDSTILALGGGVVGDLAGFVASVYKRGIDYVQIPTTLLAQVDSSIGGKTGVDAPWGKNQIGTFYQPKVVLTDTQTLRTLPSSEMLNGIAEIVKCAVVADRGMFNQLSTFQRFDSGFPTELIIRTCKIKAHVVSRDEKESNYRAILNYGHTVGHALESASKYRLAHGVCVILGMMAEAWIAFRMGILQETDFEKQSRLLRRLSRIFAIQPPYLDKRILFGLAKADKKSASGSARMSLPTEVGKMHTAEGGSYKIPISRRAFEESIDYLRGAFSGTDGE